MDTEQQVRLDFLEEAEEYFNNLESLLMDLDSQGAEPSLLDSAMRAAHSLKGGAAMMQFVPLSKIAHRLEDFLKILRVRKDNSLVDREVTNLLLKGVDCLREARNLHQQHVDIDEAWFARNTEPVFDRLHNRLGDLKEEDEDQLLAEEEQIDVSSLIFQSGVEDCLATFQAQIESLEPTQLKEALAIQAEQLMEIGQMSQIDPFIELCQSVLAELSIISLDRVKDLASEAFKQWERSQALVLIGKIDKLPTKIHSVAKSAGVVDLDIPTLDISELIDGEELTAIQNFTAQELAPELPLSTSELDSDELTPNAEDISKLDAAFLSRDNLDLISTAEMNSLDMGDDSSLNVAIDLDEFALDGTDLSELNNVFDELEIPEIPDEIEVENVEAATNNATVELDLEELSPNAAELSELNDVFDELEIPEILDEVEVENVEAATHNVSVKLDLEELSPNAAELSELNDVFANLDEVNPETKTVVESEPEEIKLSSVPAPQPQREQGRMVRVSAQRLQNLNNLSSKLILERNAAVLRLNQLQNYVSLTRDRMRRLEQSSNKLRKLYDGASLERMIPTQQSEAVVVTANGVWEEVPNSTSEKFDSLEMDRYTDLHLLSQEQIETIVQLQEVTADIDLSIREMGQVITSFSHTTRDLQQNIMRSQMRPFSELVGRFPRLIRDLSSQHNKEVDLVIQGKTIPLDRQAIELLSDPLTHLLRNAFDHGLEDSQTRIEAGKNPRGTITLDAKQQGNQTIITISDDGGGINTTKIGDRLLKLGFSQDQIEQISETELLDAIFEPGFSTAERVTELSGRGVGMDVVRSNLQKIRGDIQVQTELGKGTTFTISVPLSLLVLRVTIVETAGMVFAIPVNSIQEIVKYDPELVVHQGQQEKMIWGEKYISLLRLEESLQFQRPNKTFEMAGSPKIEDPTVLIFEDNGKSQGIYLNKYWNEQEVGIRPVKTSITLFPGFSGSTILGDGRVIPLIEPIALSKGIAKQKGISLSTLTTSDSTDKNSTFAFPVDKTSTILVIDDSVNVRRYLAGILERNNYRVEEAKDGQDAIDKLMGGLQVQAMICDVEMPRLDGYGVLSEVKSDPTLENIPIAMLTSRSNKKHRQLAMKLGASAYFSKPFNEQEMLETLASLIASG